MNGQSIAGTRWLTITFGFALVTSPFEIGCRGRQSNAVSPVQSIGSGSDLVSKPVALSAADTAVVRSGELRVLLGRVVDMGGPRVVRTLTDAPAQEVTDSAADAAVVLLEDSTLKGFRLSTGEPLWTQTPAAPCRKLTLARSMVYTGCGNKIFAFAAATGKQHLVDSRMDSTDPVVTAGGEVVVVPSGSGRINLYEAGTNRLLTSKVIPELARAFHRHVLANPISSGICALGLVAGPSKRLTYHAGCYDEHLVRQWTRVFPFPRNQPYDLRQLGPRFLVLDDQYSIKDPSLPPGPGRGLVVRWRDGQENRFDDKTFATLEDRNGDRLSLDSDIFSFTQTIPRASQNQFPHRQAKIVSDSEHVFALIVNGSTALAGVDRATGHVHFVVPVSLEVVWEIDLIGGMPIVRTRDSSRWTVTIYDPTTGRSRYSDTRPRARAY